MNIFGAFRRTDSWVDDFSAIRAKADRDVHAAMISVGTIRFFHRYPQVIKAVTEPVESNNSLQFADTANHSLKD